MPVLAVPGAAAAAPAAPVAARAAGPATTLPLGRAGDPVDVVSLSPAAQLRQALDVPALAMRQLGALLGEFEQISGLTRGAAPQVLGALAGEIGASARTLGAGVQALLPTPDAPTPLQLAGAAALRVLATLAPAQAAPPDAHPQDARPQDAHPQDTRAQDTRAQDAPFQDARPSPAAPPDAARPGVAPSGTPPASPAAPPGTRPTPAGTPVPTPAPPSPGDPLPAADPRGGAGAAWPGRGAAPDPGATPARADRSSPRGAPASPGVREPPAPGPPRAAPTPHDPARPTLAHPDPAQPDSARPDPVRQARDAALVLLREAAATLGRMQLRPRAPPAAQADRPTDARGDAWCDAQIAAALGSVAHASQRLADARPTGWPGIAAASGRSPEAPGEPARAARRHTRLALLCCLAAALWATRSLDLGVARALTASVLAVGAAAWGWRRAAGRRVRIELR
jgi:hypothetical protein